MRDATVGGLGPGERATPGPCGPARPPARWRCRRRPRSAATRGPRTARRARAQQRPRATGVARRGANTCTAGHGTGTVPSATAAARARRRSTGSGAVMRSRSAARPPPEPHLPAVEAERLGPLGRIRGPARQQGRAVVGVAAQQPGDAQRVGVALVVGREVRGQRLRGRASRPRRRPAPPRPGARAATGRRGVRRPEATPAPPAGGRRSPALMPSPSARRCPGPPAGSATAGRPRPAPAPAAARTGRRPTRWRPRKPRPARRGRWRCAASGSSGLTLEGAADTFLGRLNVGADAYSVSM